MKDSWIKVRGSLLTDPKTYRVAGLLMENRAAVTALFGDGDSNVTRNVMHHVTVSLLVTLWSTANEHTSDGIFRNAGMDYVDVIVGIPGFAAALADVGWLDFDPDSNTVILPNFTEYNTSDVEMRRQKAAERQRRYRENRGKTAEKSNGDSNAKVTSRSNGRGEERRGEKNIKKNLQKKSKSTDGPPDEIEQEFTALWKIYPKRSGSNPKARALGAYRKQRGKSELMAETIRTGVELYAAWCQATGKIGTEYVMQAAKFLGPDQHFLNDWAAPPGQQRARDAPSPYAPDDTSWADDYGADSAIEGEFVNEDLAHDRPYQP